ncbi:hypothetical protein JW930_04565 [Candidatus Woesearchaeota archaeon]|nr:hypothetical protein [Candidatus Woesearchaeota archaeon]
MKLALFNLNLVGSQIVKAEDTLSISVMKKYIGRDLLLLLPEKNVEKKEFKRYIEKILPTLKDVQLVALSVSTFSYQLARQFSKMVREEYSFLPIIIGGSHIVDEQQAKKTINEGVADIAVLGDVKGLVELLDLVEKEEILFNKKSRINVKFNTETIPKGIYYLNNGKVWGSGRAYLKEQKFPLMLERKFLEEDELDLLLNNVCPNNCGYCNSPKTIISIPVKDYISDIKSKEIKRIYLYDNNPLWRENKKRTLEFFESYKEKFKKIPDVVLYSDPSFFIEKKEFDEAVSIVKELGNRNNNLFFGREVVDEAISEKVRRKYLGDIRKQWRLDKEREVIEKFAKLANKMNFTLAISYILSPFETKESVEKMLDEVKRFSKYSKIEIKSNFLWPLPGTEIYNMHKGSFFPVEDLDLELECFDFGSINYWHKAHFLDVCFALRARIFFDYRDLFYSYYNLSAIELAKEIAFDNYDKETCTSIIKNLPKDLKKPLGDKLRALCNLIDKDELFKINNENLIRLLESYFKVFFNADRVILNRLKKEYEMILRAKSPSSS